MHWWMKARRRRARGRDTCPTPHSDRRPRQSTKGLAAVGQILQTLYADAPWAVAGAVRALHKVGGGGDRWLMDVLRHARGMLGLAEGVEAALGNHE